VSARETNSRAPRLGVLASLSISAAALLAAPTWMPPGYSWISHTTSQSAAFLFHHGSSLYVYIVGRAPLNLRALQGRRQLDSGSPMSGDG
jgi:hypothetical protein